MSRKATEERDGLAPKVMEASIDRPSALLAAKPRARPGRALASATANRDAPASRSPGPGDAAHARPDRSRARAQEPHAAAASAARRGAQASRPESALQRSPLRGARPAGRPPPPPGLGPEAKDEEGSGAAVECATETDSFDEEVELLRCQADLVEAAVEMAGGTTSADDEFLTTDPDIDDEDENVGALGAPGSLRPWTPWQRSSVASVVIEEDEEGISSGFDDDGINLDMGGSEMRSRLWAQSLLRLKRSIDEIYSLCEFESDEALCEQVRAILSTASGDFGSLITQLEKQQEYALLGGDFPFKTGVAWTTRTPRAKGGESIAEHIDRDQRSMSSPSNGSVVSGRRDGGAGVVGGVVRLAPRSADVPKLRSQETSYGQDSSGGGTGEACDAESVPARPPGLWLEGEEGVEACGGREEQLDLMVQSALHRIHSDRPSPEELLKRYEERQRRAQQLRASVDDQRVLKGRQTESRIVAARERRQEKEENKQRVLLEKMSRARRQYQDQLRMICQKARKHNMKSAEVAYIAKEAIKSEREIIKQKQAKAHLSRALLREKMQNKLIASAERVARVSESRRKQLESWQFKVQQELEEKERLAFRRRQEHMNSIRAKSQDQESRSELVRGKRRELLEEDERSSQEFLRFRNKSIARLAMNCEGLPEGVKEEVVEQLSAPARRPAGRAKAAPRPCTPPGHHSLSPKGSPKSAGCEERWASPGTPRAREEAASAFASEASSKEEASLEEAEGSSDYSEAVAQHLEALRAKLVETQLSDDDALRASCESEGNKSATSTAHRARLSKLAADLKKACIGGDRGEDITVASMNLERADTVLSEFCKVLGQSQREADFALLLKLGCAGIVVDTCSRIKDCLVASSSDANEASPAWKQMSSVMLGSLKFLGVLCKHDFARIYMLLTNRVVRLADLAVACLDMHFGSVASLPDAQSVSVLFLPQVLHVLSLHVKQPVPHSTAGVPHTLATYLMLCGLTAKLRELFRRAEIRSMKLFDGASPVPLLLLRAMGFLGSLVSAYRVTLEAQHPQPDIAFSTASYSGAGGLTAIWTNPTCAVLQMLRRTDLFGIVSILLSILLSEGRREKSSNVSLPQTVISLSFQSLRVLNQVARLDLSTLQETLGVCQRQEIYHLLVCLLDYCTARVQTSKTGQDRGQEENELLHETIVLLGYYCLQRPENQGIMCYGEGQTLLAKITSLPLHYFMEEKGRGVLFPTILATCYQSAQNLDLLRNEMNMSLLQKYLAAKLLAREAREGAKGAPADSAALSQRFPAALWQEALAFFGEASRDAEA